MWRSGHGAALVPRPNPNARHVAFILSSQGEVGAKGAVVSIAVQAVGLVGEGCVGPGRHCGAAAGGRAPCEGRTAVEGARGDGPVAAGPPRGSWGVVVEINRYRCTSWLIIVSGNDTGLGAS